VKAAGAENPEGGVVAARLTERLLADVGAAEGELAPTLTEDPGVEVEADRTELAVETEETAEAAEETADDTTEEAEGALLEA
jgi:hypothetical protein